MMIEVVVFFVVLAVMVYAGGRLLVIRRGTNDAAPEFDPEYALAGDPGKMGKDLRTLRLQVEPWIFVLSLLFVSVTIFLLFLELFPERLVLAILASLGLLIFSLFLVKDLARRRVRKFETQLTHAIDLMQTALRGGQNPLQALAVTAQCSKGRTKTEFKHLVGTLDLGASIDDATVRMRQLYDCEGVRLFCQVLHIKWHKGGNLSELLQSVNHIIRGRVKLRLRMTGQLAGVKYASVFVALMPYAVIPFFLWKYPAWLEILGGHPWGAQFLLGAILLQVLGFFWLRQLLRIPA